MVPRVPKTLYHYCGVDAFYNIIHSKSLWLSDVSESNDSAELKWAHGQYKDYATEVLNKFIVSVIDSPRRHELTEQFFEKTEDIKNHFSNHDIKCWALCASSKKDNLGQWRGYGDDGRGVSIGFNSAFLSSPMSYSANLGTDPIILFNKVNYTAKEARKLFYDTAGLSGITPESSIEEVYDCLNKAVSFTSVFSPFFKNPAFAEEKEWRLVYVEDVRNMNKGTIPQLPSSKNKYSKYFSMGKYGFTVKNQSLVSHIEFAVNSFKGLINEIIIGPKSKITIQDVKLFLISEGIIKNSEDESIKIQKSQTSYQ